MFDLKNLIIFLFISISLPYCGQVESGTWLSASIKKKVFKDLSFKTELGYRNHFLSKKLDFFRLGLKYKLSKKVKLSFGWRNGNLNEIPNTLTKINRFNFDINTKFSLIKKVKFLYRLRYQAKYSNEYTTIEEARLPNNSFRNRFLLSYKKSKKLFFIAGPELFLKHNYKTSPYFNKLRFTMGADYRIHKKHWLGIYYILQNQVQSAPNISQHILSIEYNISLD